MTSIAELPFVERPAVELLALDQLEPDPDFDGYGWTRVDQLWLSSAHGWLRRVRGSHGGRGDVLILALHAADDGAALDGDIELDFALGDRLVRCLASAFLEVWLPRLPPASAVVLAMCNPHRAVLSVPASARAPIFYAAGDAFSWRDPPDRIRLSGEAWRTLRAVSTDLIHRPGTAISDEDRQTYASLYVLKKMDLKPEDGGMVFPVVVPSELSPIDELLQQLAVDDLIVINRKKERYELTKKGIAYLGENIDEATELVDEFEDAETDDMLAELRERNLDLFRVRFLWAWCEGELDDLVLYQERRGIRPVERMWAFFLMGDVLWNDLARELEEWS